MEENKVETAVKAEDKLTYEQLQEVAHQLSEQNKQLYAKWQEANMNNLFRRLDYLFKVVEFEHIFSEDFVDKCKKEIEDIIVIPEEETDKK